MELNGALSNPPFKEEMLPKLLELKEMRLSGKRPRRPKPRPTPTLRQGQIQETVKHVLEVASKPMHLREIHELVEQELGRPVVYSTLKDCLREKRRRVVLFDRVSPGVYKIHIEVDPAWRWARRERQPSSGSLSGTASDISH